MNRIPILAGCLIAAVAVTGCAKTDVSRREGTAAGEALTRPDRVLVYDFAADSEDLPPDSVLVRLQQERATPQSEKEIALGRYLGELTAAYLIDALEKKAIPAINGSTGVLPRVGDVIIRGGFVTIDEGSATKRMLIGFGSGSAKLQTLVEAYEVTATELVSLGLAQIETAGGKMPGILVPVGVGAAAGSVIMSAAISGTSNILQETGPESIQGAARRTADEIAKVAEMEWKKRGWQ